MNIIRFVIFTFFSMISQVCLSQAEVEKKSYTMVVWADLSFDENKKLTRLEILEKNGLPLSFVNVLSSEIAKASFITPLNSDSIAMLQTGLSVLVEIDPATTSVRFVSQQLMPRPARIENLAEPHVRVRGEWSGRVFVTCTISAKGLCRKPKLDPKANAPAEVSGVLSRLLSSWRFVPQKKLEKEIGGEYSTWITIEADNSAPPKTFDRSIESRLNENRN